MSFWFGALIGIPFGVFFGQRGLKFPLNYSPKPTGTGFGRISLNLQVLDPIKIQMDQIWDYIGYGKKPQQKKAEGI